MYSSVTKSQYKLFTLKSQCQTIIPLIQNRDVRTITLVLFSLSFSLLLEMCFAKLAESSLKMRALFH